MTNLAVIKVKGFQYLVNENQDLTLPRLHESPEKEVIFDQVLLIATDDGVTLGDPIIKDAQVKAKVVSHLSGSKIRVATYKAKARYRKVKGFRSSLTRVKIISIIQSKDVNRQSRRQNPTTSAKTGKKARI